MIIFVQQLLIFVLLLMTSSCGVGSGGGGSPEGLTEGGTRTGTSASNLRVDFKSNLAGDDHLSVTLCFNGVQYISHQNNAATTVYYQELWPKGKLFRINNTGITNIVTSELFLPEPDAYSEIEFIYSVRCGYGAQIENSSGNFEINFNTHSSLKFRFSDAPVVVTNSMGQKTEIKIDTFLKDVSKASSEHLVKKALTETYPGN